MWYMHSHAIKYVKLHDVCNLISVIEIIVKYAYTVHVKLSDTCMQMPHEQQEMCGFRTENIRHFQR